MRARPNRVVDRCFVFPLDKLPGKSFDVQYMSEVGSRCVGKVHSRSISLIHSFTYSEDGFYPDKDDCRKFHVCYSGTQSIRWCKEGMIWDETKIGCSMQNNTVCTGARKKWGRNEGM